MKGDFTRDTFNPTKHYDGVPMQQGRVQLDADWNEQLDIDAHLRETVGTDIIGPCGAPQDNAGFGFRRDDTGELILEDGAPVLEAGRCYVDGIPCELEEDTPFTQQPDYPGAAFPPEDGDGTYLVYLDVWKRHITALQDDGIREVALGGPDTATRIQRVCQVKLFRVPSGTQCASPLPEWEESIAPSSGTLSARAEPEDEDGPCLVPQGAGFNGSENHLFRVQIREPGQLDEATFIWSRDNGSNTTAIEAFEEGQPEITLSTLGRDEVWLLREGDTVEVLDDATELVGEPDGAPGLLATIVEIDSVARTVTLDQPVTGLDQGRHPILRRWDSEGELPVEVPDDNEGFILLEHGVQVRFEEGQYRTGDYWLISARTATADVEWPTDESGEALPQLPLGIEHHYCRLALIEIGDGSVRDTADCRHIFPPLTEREGEESGIRITAVQIPSSLFPDVPLLDDFTIGLPVFNDSLVTVARFANNGLRVVCDSDIAEEAFQPAEVEPASPARPNCQVTLDIPWPLGADAEFWGNPGVVGFQSIVLAAEVSADGDRIEWRPTSATRDWLVGDLFQRLSDPNVNQTVDRLLARLNLKGNFIWSGSGEELVHLDGDVFGTPGLQGRVDLDLPSGDSRRGGDFEMWFWLTEEISGGLNIDPVLIANSFLGSVNDNDGPIEGAAVALIRAGEPDPVASTITDADGAFRFLRLSPGPYAIAVETTDGRSGETALTVPELAFDPNDFPGRTVDEISGIGPVLRERLEALGLDHPAHVASAEPSRLAEVLGIAEMRAARFVDDARRLLES